MRLGVELADVLAHLHDHRVVHGALMPSTVPSAARAARGHGIGTAYTSTRRVGVQHAPPARALPAPEQIAGAGGDARVDLYALGPCPNFTGRPPFDDASDVAASVRRLREDAPDPARLAPVPAPRGDRAAGCPRADPSRRFADARALSAALRSQTAPAEPRRATRGRPRRWSWRL
ncbi:MAG: hypothetical protein U0326_11305 [Polyangiales bacterium]